MDIDTDIGGPLHRFPVTNHSAIMGARSDDHVVRRRAFETILVGVIVGFATQKYGRKPSTDYAKSSV